jgi:hypothetical protein
MTKDPIVEEVHAVRDELSKEAGDDLLRIVEAAKRRQQESAKSHAVVTLPPKRIAPTRKAS